MPTSRGPLQPVGPGRATIDRFDPSPALADLIRHHWIARWDIPAGAEHEQRILAYPSCNLIVEVGGATPDPDGTLFGPITGLSRKRLTGQGRALGVLLQPAPGSLLSDVPMPELADASRPAGAIGFTAGPAIAAALAGTPEDDGGSGAAPSCIGIFERWLADRLPDGADEEGLLANRIVNTVEHDAGLLRVRELAARLGLGERALQRVVGARLGLTPKWLIQRRRLQEAAYRLSQGAGPGLARLAYALEYADQAHFSRDFSSVVGMSPTQYLRQPGTAPTRH
jgi:AraC-like DNA-binding protein